MNHRNFNELRKKMKPQRLAEATARTQKMMKEMLLREVRTQARLTQVDVAKVLGIHQPNLSRLEAANDMQISTLRRLVHALGGELQITAKLPHGVVSLTQFTDNRA